MFITGSYKDFRKAIMNSLLKKSTFSFKYKETRLDSLKSPSSKITPIKYKCYAAYGNILDLVNESVDYEALTTLAQYYDIPMCCFTFPDFQMAPTLEVFKRILNRSIKDHNPFPKIEEYFAMPKLASVLGVDVGELAASWAPKGIGKGFARKFLEGHARRFDKEKEVGVLNISLSIIDLWDRPIPKHRQLHRSSCSEHFLVQQPDAIPLGRLLSYFPHLP